MAREPENSGLKALREARAVIADLVAAERPDHPLAAAHALLARVEAEMRRLLELKPIRTRSGHNVGYRIEVVDGEPLLTERRAGSDSRPFRVRRDVYDAAAQVLDGADRPLLFEEVVEGVNQKVRLPPPTFHIRTCLRFWTREPSTALLRLRTRYRPASPGKFRVEAGRLWAELAAQGPKA